MVNLFNPQTLHHSSMSICCSLEGDEWQVCWLAASQDSEGYHHRPSGRHWNQEGSRARHQEEGSYRWQQGKWRPPRRREALLNPVSIIGPWYYPTIWFVEAIYTSLIGMSICVSLPCRKYAFVWVIDCEGPAIGLGRQPRYANEISSKTMYVYLRYI